MRLVRMFVCLLFCLPAFSWSAIGGDNALGGGSFHKRRNDGLVVDAATTFWLYPDYVSSGPSKLDDTLSEASFAGSLTLVAACDASDATGTSWTCASGTSSTKTFSTSGGGDNTSGLGLHPHGWDDGTVSLRTAGSTSIYNYGAPDSTTGDIGSGDLIVEITGAFAASGSIGKKDNCSSATDAGWCITATGNPRMYVADGTTNQTASVGASGRFNHYICFYRHNDASGMQCFQGGVAGTAVTTATTTGSKDNAVTMSLTSSDAGDTNGWSSAGSLFAVGISSVRVWTAPAQSIVNAERQAIATTRASKSEGLHPISASGQYYPTTKTRATTKYCDRMGDDDVRHIVVLSNGTFCKARRKELTGGEYVEGILIEPSHTNLCLQSETFANASWTENNIGAVSEGSSSDPRSDGGSVPGTADSLEGTDGAGSVEHFMRQAITLTATTYTASVYVKAGGDANVTHAWIRNNTVANAIGWVNLSTCAAGTKGAGASQLHAENWGNGWCRLGITFAGTVASHNIDIGYSAADNATAFDDGTDSDVDLIVWGAQVEAQALPLSYVLTTTASAASNADDIRFAALGNLGSTSTIVAKFMSAPYDNGTATVVGVRVDANNTETIYADGTSDNGRSGGTVSGVSQWDITSTSGDVTDGELHTLQLAHQTNSVRLWQDTSLAGVEDTSATMVTMTSAVIQPGGSGAAANMLGGIISDIHIYSDVRTP